MPKPLLTIGIMFKNNIRCLEKCLKALQPIRDAIPCELLLADTGSEDGSREVAERYGDLVYDFPWIDDFAAARNSLMERAQGSWYFSIDSDEYWDGDVGQLEQFLRSNLTEAAGIVVIRNYFNYELEGEYSDFMTARLLRMSEGLRYYGAIHEQPRYADPNREVYGAALRSAVLLHDGYVELNQPNSAKSKRNLTLLRKKLDADPEDITTWLQLIESSANSPDLFDNYKKAIELIKGKKKNWERSGPAILRYAVLSAVGQGRPELEEWIGLAESMFPDSAFTRIDVEYAAFFNYWNKKDYPNSVRKGEYCLQSILDDRVGRGDPYARMTSNLMRDTPQWEWSLRLVLANAHVYEKNPARAQELLEGIDMAGLEGGQVLALVQVMREFQSRSEQNLTPLLLKLWESLGQGGQNEKRAKERKDSFYQSALLAFLPGNIEAEEQAEGFCRHGYTLFLPLKGELGLAAAVMETEGSECLTRMLLTVKNWNDFPVHAFFHALVHGARFPLPGKPLTLEKMDEMADRMAKSQDRDEFPALACRPFPEDDLQALCWSRALTLAAVQNFNWENDGEGMELARAFAKVEKKFLPLCYAPEIFKEDHLFMIPPMHRFGWYCVQAFDALDAGRAADYVRLLREGLAACESMKPMAEFLLDHTPELKTPSDELRKMADQVREILSQFSPDDPAVTAIKQTEAYKKVAYLIEGTEVPVVGGQMQ